MIYLVRKNGHCVVGLRDKLFQLKKSGPPSSVSNVHGVSTKSHHFYHGNTVLTGEVSLNRLRGEMGKVNRIMCDDCY